MIRPVLITLLSFFSISCSAVFDWRLPVESCYEQSEMAMQLYCSECTAHLSQSSKVDVAKYRRRADGTFEILYNRNQLIQIQRMYKRPAAVWVFAHELAHIKLINMGYNDDETSADWHSGCLMAAMDEPLGPAFRLLSDRAKVDSTHPPASERISTISYGFEKCNNRLKIIR